MLERLLASLVVHLLKAPAAWWVAAESTLFEAHAPRCTADARHAYGTHTIHALHMHCTRTAEALQRRCTTCRFSESDSTV